MNKLNQIVDFLSRKIPNPAKPKAKPQKSFARLKTGDFLRVRTGEKVYTLGVGLCPAGSLFEVLNTDSLGMRLLLRSVPFSTDVDGTFRWELRGWEGTFEKVPKRSALKELKET